MANWIKKHKIITCISIFTLFIVFIVGIPILLNKVYYIKAPFNFLHVTYGVDSILNYYSAVLTFMGTVILGIIAVYQNYIAQKKSERVNELTLELQKKSMAMAEQNYLKTMEEDKIKNTPKFQIINTYSNGYGYNLHLNLTNLNDFIVTNITSLEFEIIDKQNILLYNSNSVFVKTKNLLHGQVAEVETNCPGIKEDNTRIAWSFSCTDKLSKIHYFKAILYVEDREKLHSYEWEVNKVG